MQLSQRAFDNKSLLEVWLKVKLEVTGVVLGYFDILARSDNMILNRLKGKDCYENA